MNAADLKDHLQRVYFDNVDCADADAAVKAFSEDVSWQHTQVWPHHGHSSRTTDRLLGRQALLEFLGQRVVQTQEVQIQHKVRKVVVDGASGAFRGYVLGPDGQTRDFLGWVDLREGLITRYIVVPEDFTA
jgi:hypothetical protein